MRILTLPARRARSEMLETMAERDKRMARDRFWKDFRGAVKYLSTHAFAALFGAGILIVQVSPRLNAGPTVHLVEMPIAPAPRPTYRCTKTEAVAMTSAFREQVLSLHELAEYSEMCKTRLRMEQVKPNKE